MTWEQQAIKYKVGPKREPALIALVFIVLVSSAVKEIILFSVLSSLCFAPAHITELTGGFEEVCTNVLTLYMFSICVMILVFFAFAGKKISKQCGLLSDILFRCSNSNVVPFASSSIWFQDKIKRSFRKGNTPGLLL